MKKKLLFFVGIFTLIFTFNVYAIDITIDNEKVVFDNAQPFIDENGRTQVPLRATMESFGAYIEWDNENRIAIVKSDNIEVKVPVLDENVENPYILVNDIKVEIDTTAIIKDGRTHLPIRAVVEAFGANVEWDGENNTVIINKSSANKEEIDEDIISYENFRDMFDYEVQGTFNNNVRINAKYIGNMNKSEFKGLWESMSVDTISLYYTEIAKEKQSKNPDCDASVYFLYYDKSIDENMSLGYSRVGNTTMLFPINPFEKIKLNPVN